MPIQTFNPDLSIYKNIKGYSDFQQESENQGLARALTAAQIAKTQYELTAGAGGDDPSAVKVAKELQRSEFARQNALKTGDTAGAQQLTDYMNNIVISHKSYDKGISGYSMPAPQYTMPELPIQGAVSGKVRGSSAPLYTPPQDGEMAVDEYIDMPLPPTQGGMDFSQYPDLQFTQAPRFGSSTNIQPISGYAEAVGGIAATKKGMEEQAKQNVKISTAAEIERQKMIGKGEISPIEKQAKAKASVTRNLNTIAGYYNKLDELGAAVSPNRDTLSNIGARAASTTVGQIAGRTIGSEEQTIRDNINQMRPTLMSDIRQATEMGAKGLDSEKELEFYLQAVSNPTRSLESNKAALAVLNNAYGLGSGVKATPEAIEALRAEFEANISGSQPPAQAGRSAPITATGANGQKLQLINGQWQPI